MRVSRWSWHPADVTSEEENQIMKKSIVRLSAAAATGLAAAVIGVAAAGPAAALVNPTTGQPGAPTNTCGPDNLVTPGHSASSPGSPFNPNGQAGLVYAGNPGTVSLTHANSTAAVSQYDVACVQLSH
jgi:hypothetical protein